MVNVQGLGRMFKLAQKGFDFMQRAHPVVLSFAG